MTRIWILIGALTTVVVLSITAWPLVWFRAYGISVTYNEARADDARVYLHRGDIFIDLGRTSVPPYIIRPKDNVVGIPGNSFVATTSLIALAKVDPIPIVDIRSGKNGTRDPKPALTQKSATFVDNDGQKIRLDWWSP